MIVHFKLFVYLKNFNLRKMGTYKVVMVRHGESEWNQKNLFCGWYDAQLSAKGRYVRFTLSDL